MSRDGSIDWLCLTRFDAPSVFGRLLGDDAGHWTITPVDAVATTRSYLGSSLVLETTHRCAGGALVVTDALAVPLTDDPHGLGLTAPHVLLRRVRCVEGSASVDVTFAPRPEYGLTTPVLEPCAGGLRSYGGPDGYVLAGDAGWEVDGGTARARLHLTQGEQVAFALQHHATSDDAPTPWPAPLIDSALADTRRAWDAWDAEHAAYDGPYSEAVSISARVLQGLSYAPSGATIAAPTTSLTEAVGAGRTWDFRYAWLRDAALTMRALWVAACPDESSVFFDWALRATADQSPSSVQIVYGVGGERLLQERELEHLPGWRDTGPVRIGNGAWSQAQHDVYGELLDAAWLLREQAGPFTGVQARVLAGLADEAADCWGRADSGIWEVRGEERHYVSSKAMCWVALDRAVRLVEHGSLEAGGEQVAAWRRAARELHDDLRARGWNAEVGSFTQSYDSVELDASALLLVLYDVLDRDDPQLRATVETLERRLDREGLLDRYTSDDGLPGREGAFLLCSFWLAEAWARLGEPARARRVFERTVACANDIGLMAEQADPGTGDLLGNFPQAFSHVGLVNAAQAIGEAERGGVPTVAQVGSTQREHGSG
ncbi:MAG: glycoside hydrolase family 15 protein [Thermoleophilia bacterium]|nr:glycoside hydrolase family 15 protein [Thermoleophilia bacterium]